MNPNRSGVEKVDWGDLAANITVKLLEALDQLTKDSQGRSISLANNDLNKLVKRRLVTIGQLKTVLESFSVPDLVDIAAESQITNIVLVDELLKERNELGLLKENLVSNVGNLGDLLTNRSQRDENLIKIVQGLRQETEAIEDENDEEEFQKLRRMRNDIRAVLNTILDEAYPEMKTDVKKIIQALYEVKEKEDNYIQVPDNVDAQAINLLLTANIIKYHETEPQLISLMF
uniref:Carbamoyl-phosphate synthase large chain n=2 Tax=Lygus hesperus TaxID=30085 RepID=A0A0A9YJL4_LYGHE